MTYCFFMCVKCKILLRPLVDTHEATIITNSTTEYTWSIVIRPFRSLTYPLRPIFD